MSERIKITARVLHGDEIAMGPGKADLLEAIARTGSISAAGRELGMSYRRSWMLVDTMNRCWREPLVATVVGGRTGARLTDNGRHVLANYRALEAALAQVSSGALATGLLDGLADPSAG
jgi:molybdate transport system regulatory protein